MRNINVAQYARLKDTTAYDAVYEFMNPSNKLLVRHYFLLKRELTMNVNSMPYANVKHCIRLLSKSTNWETIQQIFEICFDISDRDFYLLPIHQFYAARNYVTKEFNRVVQVESKVLASQSTDEHLWQMAGAERLKPYNDTLPLVQMGKLFGHYPFDIGRKPYGEVFTLLAQLKVQGEVEAEYQKLKTKK